MNLFLKIALIAASVIIFFAVLVKLKIVAVPLILAFFIAYAFHPVVDFLESKKINRTFAVFLIFLLFAIILSLFAFIIFPDLFDEIQSMIGLLPELSGMIKEKFLPWIKETTGISINIDKLLRDVDLSALTAQTVPPLESFFSNVFTSILNIIVLFFNIIIFLVFTFYFLRYYNRIVRAIDDMIPPRHRDKVRTTADLIDQALSRFIRGQITICILLAFIYSIILTLIGAKLSVAIGVISGLLNFIPYAGLIFGLASSLLFSIIDFPGWGTVLGICLVFTAVPLCDALFITPNILGRKVGLNPVVIIISLLIGAELLGILGVLLAVPSAAIIRVLIIEGYRYYKTSSFYTSQ
jgi:predicted PurR-regulated permease PerM